MTAQIRDVPRWRDEQVLHWLHLHLNCGISVYQIEKRRGLTQGSVAHALRPILKEMREDEGA